MLGTQRHRGWPERRSQARPGTEAMTFRPITRLLIQRPITRRRRLVRDTATAGDELNTW